jgi:hypothetical protein
MTGEPVRWAVVEWDDGTVSLTDVSLLDKAEDGDHPDRSPPTVTTVTGHPPDHPPDDRSPSTGHQ